MNPVVQIEKLNQYYQEGNYIKQTLFDINLKIHPQEFVILTGESGSGKTTLLSLMGCLRSVKEGSLKVLGYELNGANEIERMKLRRRVGYVFQHFNLLDFMTVQQNVMISLEMQDDFVPKEALLRSQEMVAAVGLSKYMNAYPRELSGGQKQRVAIARALVHRPPLLLADEPTASLDRRTGQEVIELIIDLAKQEGSAVLLVTHNSRIFGTADRIIRMEDGKLEGGYQDQLSMVLPALTDKQLLDLIPHLRTANYQPGETIIRQGDMARNFYILVEGEVEVIKENTETDFTLLKKLNPNTYFGEIGLMHGSKHTATVRSSSHTNSKVITIDQEIFRQMTESSQMTYAMLNHKALEILAENTYNPNLLENQFNLEAPLNILSFQPGDVIIRQGEIVNCFYGIMEGMVEVLQADLDGKPVHLKTLGRANYFGKVSLPEGKPSEETVRAAGDSEVKLMVINPMIFKRMMLEAGLLESLRLK
jgi:ABC exporter DevA family ATP-binding subunit